MSAVTGIEWTDRTWNPVTGCTKVSPGCAHCYAEGVAGRFWATQYPKVPDEGFGIPGAVNKLRTREFTDVQMHEDRLLEPLSWRKPARVFVNSMSDLFHEDVPDDFIDQVFATMAWCDRHTFQILTKRAERMRAYMDGLTRIGLHETALRLARSANVMKIPSDTPTSGLTWPLPNVWLGVSVEDQKHADLRIPLLLQTPAAVRFISAEPLIGPVNLARLPMLKFVKPGNTLHGADGLVVNVLKGVQGWMPKLDWVIVGGESGSGARPCDLAWVRSIVAQCQAAGVSVFVKQLGAKPIAGRMPHPDDMFIHLKDRKGGDIAEWPEDVQVREFPRMSFP